VKKINIPKFSKMYFEEYCQITVLKNSSLFLVRQDGVMVYHLNGLGDKIDSSSIGALLGGVWQAAEALSNFIPRKEPGEGFKLSFDTSSQGLYIQPISILGEPYYLGLLYAEELNPAMIKSKLRLLAMNYMKAIDQELDVFSEDEKIEDKDYLFKNITDEEMDRLFRFV